MFGRSGDIFDEFDREFAEMNRLMERMLEGVRQTDWSQAPPGQPLYYGVSIEVGPDGVPHVERFGNVRPAQQGKLESGVREPYVSTIVDEENHQLRVTAEMPGVDKESVKVTVRGEDLVLRAEGKDRSYEKTVRLQVPIDEDSAKARYNNGVLEVTLDLEKPEEPEGRDVQVE